MPRMNPIGLAALLSGVLQGAADPMMKAVMRPFRSVTADPEDLAAFNKAKDEINTLDPSLVDSAIVIVWHRSPPGEICPDCKTVHEDLPGHPPMNMRVGMVGSPEALKGLLLKTRMGLERRLEAESDDEKLLREIFGDEIMDDPAMAGHFRDTFKPGRQR